MPNTTRKNLKLGLQLFGTFLKALAETAFEVHGQTRRGGTAQAACSHCRGLRTLRDTLARSVSVQAC